ncbi:MAG: hypothetical protein K6E99_01940 [Bacilli bacterium]|nr:hypothetical protein [Bacilli bacterium]
MKKILILLVLFISFNSVNVHAEEFANKYIDIEEPQILIDQYEDISKNKKTNDIYFNTDEVGNVTTISINDTSYSSTDAGLVTPVKNQRNTGSCWAHAGMSILETAAIKEGKATTDINLSEMHLVYGTHANAFSDKEMKNRFYIGGALNSSHNGGNIIMTASYLFSGLGAVNDNLFPLKTYSSYGSGEIKPVNSSGNEVQITSAEYASIDATPEFYVNNFNSLYGTYGSCKDSVDDIKQMILEYGSVQVSINWNNSYVHNSYYFVNTSKNTTNHAVTLVGWDDSIEASMFGFSDSSKTGGWIMKNSWGTEKGNNGYYYVSYYDRTICGTVSTFSGIDTNKYDHTYDSSGMYYSSIIYMLEDKDVFQASIFENEGTNEELKKVSFAVNPGYDYVVYYALYDDGNWKNNNDSWIEIGTMDGSDISYYGIKSLNINSKINITDKYVIIIKGSKPDDTPYNTAVITYKDKEYKDNTISTYKMEVVDDTNYYSVNGSDWVDLATYQFQTEIPCENNNSEMCTYDSADYYDGAQNTIYAYTKEISNKENAIESTIVDENGTSVENFYSFDLSKFKIDYSSINMNIENYYPVIINSNSEDYTSKFNVQLDDINSEIIITNMLDEYIPFGEYSFTLNYDLDNEGLFDYKITSTLIVSKPFEIDSLNISNEDGKIYGDTTFDVLLKNYASTLNDTYLTYVVMSGENNVTNQFNISYSNGKTTVSPIKKVNDGNYTLTISISSNDSENISFSVNKSYALNFTTENEELILTPDTNTHTVTIEEINNNVSSVYGYSILDSNDEVITPSIIGTGFKLKINTSTTESITYTFIVIGDLSGDGKISTADYVRLWNHLDRSNSYTITDPIVLKAADVSLDNKLSTSDYVKLWNQLKRG